MTQENLSIVMPVYNEEEIVGKVVKEWCHVLDGLDVNYEFHAYDDGSKDNTKSILENLKSECPNLVIHSDQNKGHGPTVLQAYKENRHKDWIFQIDSDGEISPKYFKSFWDNRSDYDIVIGNRVNYDVNVIRQIVTKCASTFVRIFYGSGIRDTNVPYRLIRSKSYSKIFDLIPSDSFTSNVILSAATNLTGLKVKQYEIEHNFRTTGESIYVGKRFLKGVWQSFYQALVFRFKFIKANS